MMQYAELRPITLAAIAVCAIVATTSLGQEYKKGDQVVALRDTVLKAGPKTVGTVRKGEKLTVEEIQSTWLWVRVGETRGWIDSRNVAGPDDGTETPGQQHGPGLRVRLEGERVAVYNLAGHAEVVPGTGSDVVVEVRRGGKDGARLRDEVVALSDAALKAGSKTVATVRKGEKLTVEQIQDKWFWVESNGVNGWVDNRAVMPGTLFEWYEKLPDMTTAPLVASVSFSVGKSGRSRGKIFGVCFELRGLPPGEDAAICFDHRGPGTTVIGSGVVVSGNVVSAKGHRLKLRENGVFVAYQAVSLSLDKLNGQTRAVTVNGRSYGLLREGDHVSIDASEEVVVNGHVRKRQ